MTKSQPDTISRRNYTIHMGEVFASKTPAIVRTVVGSCISVCLYDPIGLAGGMNHFMLPHNGGDITYSARYGVHSMELLINDCMRAGADRRRLRAKVFGGGHVLRIRELQDNVPQSNIKFILNFLSEERIPVASQDLGGYVAREILFYTDTARVLLKRLPIGGQDYEARIAEIERVEREELTRSAPSSDQNDDNVTLFLNLN